MVDRSKDEDDEVEEDVDGSAWLVVKREDDGIGWEEDVDDASENYIYDSLAEATWSRMQTLFRQVVQVQCEAFAVDSFQMNLSFLEYAHLEM